MAWEDIKPSNIKRLWNPSVSGICHVGAWRAAEIHEYKENFCGVSGIVGDFPVTFIEADKSIEEHIANSIAVKVLIFLSWMCKDMSLRY